MELRLNHEGILIGAWLGHRSECIIYCPGLPQYVSKYHPIVRAAERTGVNLFVPRYRGTWESDGTFSVASSVQTVDAIIRLVKEGHASELFSHQHVVWTCERVILIGFSYGALPALLSKEHTNRIALIAPFTNTIMHEENYPGDLHRTLEFLRRGYPHVYRFEDDKFLTELSHIEYPDVRDNLVVIYGAEDQTVSNDEIEWLRGKYNANIQRIKGGHSSDIGDEVLMSLLR